MKILALLALAACGKPPTDDDFSQLGPDTKSDAFSSHMKILGTISPGGSARVHYSNPPKYRGFTLEAPASLAADVWVRSTNGDAMVWILDDKNHVVAKNDDASSGTTDAHVTATLAAGSYTIALREYDSHTADLTLTLSSPCTPTTCAAHHWDCGTASDGCGRALDCGACDSGFTCGAFNPNICGQAPACASQGQLCNRNGDCCGTLACYEGLCERPRPNGTVCESDRDCASGVCCHGNCGPCPSEPPGQCSGIDGDCWSQSDCCAGFVCVGGDGRIHPGACR
jgi:hypothetical protein